MSEKLTLKELTEAVASATSWSKTLTHVFIKEMFAVIAEGLETDGEVKLKGLGWFRLRWVEPRMGRNPQTGAPLLIPGYRKVLFKPDKSLRELVNRRYGHLKPVFLKESSAQEPGNVVEMPVQEPEPIFEAPPPQVFAEDEFSSSDSKNWVSRAALIGIALLLLALLLLWQKPWQKIHHEPAMAQTLTAENTDDMDDTDPVADPEMPAPTPTTSVNRRTVRPGDTLWDMAGEFYAEQMFWPLIYGSNRNTLSDPDLLEPQQILTLESLQGSRLQLTQSDSVRLREGYHLVYLAYQQKGKPGAEDYQRVAEQFE
ncbi:HU family DNA-binding protein [candidate division KSB1 bacterium]|nr:HU family DNA-binding protein [candidate division KSB1 bacterium]